MAAFRCLFLQILLGLMWSVTFSAHTEASNFCSSNAAPSVKISNLANTLRSAEEHESLRGLLQNAGFHFSEADFRTPKGFSDHQIVTFSDPETHQRYILKYASKNPNAFSKMGRFLIDKEIDLASKLSGNPHIAHPVASNSSAGNASSRSFVIRDITSTQSLQDFLGRLEKKSEVDLTDIKTFFNAFTQLTQTVSDFHKNGQLLVDIDPEEIRLDGQNLLLMNLSSVMEMDEARKLLTPLISINHNTSPEGYNEAESLLYDRFETENRFQHLERLKTALKKIDANGDLYALGYILHWFNSVIQDKASFAVTQNMSDSQVLIDRFVSRFGHPLYDRNSDNTDIAVAMANSINDLIQKLK